MILENPFATISTLQVVAFCASVGLTAVILVLNILAEERGPR